MKILCRNICIGLFLGMILVMLGGCGSEKKLHEVLPEVDFEHDTPVGEILQERVIRQGFINVFREITDIELYGATYKRSNTGTLVIGLYVLTTEAENNSEQLLATWQVDVAGMQDNTVLHLPMSKAQKEESCQLQKGQSCFLQITSPDAVPGNAVTLWTTQEDFYPDGCLSVDGYDWYNDLWFQVKGK